MPNIVYEEVLKFKKQINDKLSISITNIIFIFNCFFIWKSEYLGVLNLKRYIPSGISDVISNMSYLLYDNLLRIFIVIGLLIISIAILVDKTHIFFKKNTDDITLNPYLAILRLINIACYLAGPLFVYFMSINLILNEKETINFFLLKTEYFKKSGIGILHLLFVLNIFYTLYITFRSLFISKGTDLIKFYISGENLPLYVEFNSFVVFKSDCKIKTMILKEKYKKNPIFYLVEGAIDRTENVIDDIFNEERTSVVKIPLARQTFLIIDSSNDLFEIDYLFNKLKSNKKNTI